MDRIGPSVVFQSEGPTASRKVRPPIIAILRKNHMGSVLRCVSLCVSLHQYRIVRASFAHPAIGCTKRESFSGGIVCSCVARCGIIPFMEKLATDIYTFEKLVKNGFTYIDKTDRLWPLVNLSIGSQFFIARPRRFGKSLTISVLQALFEGKRELFEGLFIEPLWDWSKRWPVLRLDLGSVQPDRSEQLDSLFTNLLEDEARRNGISLRRGELASITFCNLINDLAATSPDGQIVLLVDEYDKPLLKNLNTPGVRTFRDALKAFYSVIKTLEGKQRFTFITGISKFSKVSIFSDLNNLVDVTLDSGQATLFGYTHDEVLRFLPGLLHRFSEANGWTDAQGFAELIRWYDGYRFNATAERVINPVSLGRCLMTGELRNYWSTTAMTTFLMDTLKAKPLNFAKVDVDESVLGTYEPDQADFTTLLFQTGYLTIAGFQQRGASRRYTLDFPNLEVENSFLRQVVPAYTGQEFNRANDIQADAVDALYDHAPMPFIDALKRLFANIPYDLTDRQNEQMWQAIVYVVLKMVGVAVEAEVKTNEGRIDMTAETPDHCYVIEFKLDTSAAAALAQIKANRYAEKFAGNGKTLTLVGLAFSKEKRTIVDSAIEEVQA